MPLRVMEMGKLAINHYRKKMTGLTLIEVLIALAIVSIALAAIIKAVSQNIRGTTYLQDKTMAMWVGQQTLNEARVGVLRLPAAPAAYKTTVMMLNREWYVEANQVSTPNRRIKKINVAVFAHDNEIDDEQTPLIQLESYIYDANAN